MVEFSKTCSVTRLSFVFVSLPRLSITTCWLTLLRHRMFKRSCSFFLTLEGSAHYYSSLITWGKWDTERLNKWFQWEPGLSWAWYHFGGFCRLASRNVNIIIHNACNSGWCCGARERSCGLLNVPSRSHWSQQSKEFLLERLPQAYVFSAKLGISEWWTDDALHRMGWPHGHWDFCHQLRSIF